MKVDNHNHSISSFCNKCFIYLFIFWLFHMAYWILFPQPEIKPTSSAMEMQDLNHWIIKEVPILAVFIAL